MGQRWYGPEEVLYKYLIGLKATYKLSLGIGYCSDFFVTQARSGQIMEIPVVHGPSRLAHVSDLISVKLFFNTYFS